MKQNRKDMKFYHGSTTEISQFTDRYLYLSSNIEHCLEFSNNDGFVYETEIDINEAEVEEDFSSFDCGGYTNPNYWDSNVVLNQEYGWVFIKDASKRKFNLVKN